VSARELRFTVKQTATGPIFCAYLYNEYDASAEWSAGSLAELFRLIDRSMVAERAPALIPKARQARQAVSVVELFAARDLATRRALWVSLKKNPRRKALIRMLVSTGNVMTYHRGIRRPPPSTS
jgi:hypothetical protein